MPAHRIDLGVDGSAGAQAAMGWCAAHAGLFGAHVLAIHAVPQVLAGAFPQPIRPTPATPEELLASAETLEKRCAPLRDALTHQCSRPVLVVPA